MPLLSMFYGILIYMYNEKNSKHHLPHLHVEYQDEIAVVSIPDGQILAGSINPKKMKLVQAWIEIHEDELIADWKIASSGGVVIKIDPLK